MNGKGKSTIDRLIADSKQVTADLLVLRRFSTSSVRAYRSSYHDDPAVTRARLILDQMDTMRDQLYALWEVAVGLREPEPEPAFPRPDPRPLTNGALRLIGGSDD